MKNGAVGSMPFRPGRVVRLLPGALNLAGGLLLSTSLLAGNPALAASFRGVLDRATPAEAKYLLNCPPVEGVATEGLSFRVNALNQDRPFRLSLTVNKGAEQAGVEDPVNGDRQFGAANTLAEGDGDYFLTVSKIPESGKLALGRAAFVVEAYCQSARAQPMATSAPMKLKPIPSGFQAFSGAILTAPGAQVRYRVVCYPENNQATARYGFRVSANSQNALFGVKLTVSKQDSIEETVDYDAADGEFSEWTYLETGDGVYHLTLTKEAEAGDARGKIAFKVENACEAEEEGRFSGITVQARE